AADQGSNSSSTSSSPLPDRVSLGATRCSSPACTGGSDISTHWSKWPPIRLTFTFNLSGASGATIARSTGTGTILDDHSTGGATEIGSPVRGAVQDLFGSGNYGTVQTGLGDLPIPGYTQPPANTPYASRGTLEFNVGTLASSAGTVNLPCAPSGLRPPLPELSAHPPLPSSPSLVDF